MEPARPLREVFADLIQDEGARNAYTADPDGFLGAYGHADLSVGQVSEAIVSFADTAPPAVAEHLAPFVMAHSVVVIDAAETSTDPGVGLDLLAAAPNALDVGDVAADLDDEVSVEMVEARGSAYTPEPTVDLGFGRGAEQAPPVGRDEPDGTSPPVEAMPDADATVDDPQPTDEWLMDRLDLPSPDEYDVDGDAIE
jgi:hypothetical protein